MNAPFELLAALLSLAATGLVLMASCRTPRRLQEEISHRIEESITVIDQLKNDGRKR